MGLARCKGANLTLLSLFDAMGTDVVAEVLEMTAGGVGHAFEATGRPKAAEHAFNMLRRGGTANIIGTTRRRPALKPRTSAGWYQRNRHVAGAGAARRDIRGRRGSPPTPR